MKKSCSFDRLIEAALLIIINANFLLLLLDSLLSNNAIQDRVVIK